MTVSRKMERSRSSQVADLPTTLSIEKLATLSCLMCAGSVLSRRRSNEIGIHGIDRLIQTIFLRGPRI